MRFLFLFLVMSVNLFAQKKYTLEECLSRALSFHPDVMLQNLTILRAENAVEQSQQNRYPKLSGSVSTGLNGGRSIDPFSNSFVQRTVSHNSLGLSGSWNLFNGFALKNQVVRNKINAEAEHIQMELVKRELKISVIEAFMNVVLNTKLVDIQLENEKELLTQLEAIHERIKEGIMAGYNKTETEAQLANTRFELVNSQNNLKLSKAALAQWMMLKEPIEIRMSETTQNKQEILKPALSSHPSLRILDKRIQAARYGIAIAQAEKLPRLSLNAGLGTSYSSVAAGEFAYFRQLGHNFNQYLGLSLLVPVYTHAYTRIEAARIEEKMAFRQKEKQELQLQQQIDNSLLAISTLKEKGKSASVNAAAQSVLYEGAKEKYKEGLINNLELNTYRLNLEKAKTQEIQTRVEEFYATEKLKVLMEQ